MNDNIDLTLGQNGIKRIYYGEQGNKHDFNQQLQRQKDIEWMKT